MSVWRDIAKDLYPGDKEIDSPAVLYSRMARTITANDVSLQFISDGPDDIEHIYADADFDSVTSNAINQLAYIRAFKAQMEDGVQGSNNNLTKFADEIRTRNLAGEI